MSDASRKVTAVATGSTSNGVQDGIVRAGLAEVILVVIRIINAHFNIFTDSDMLEIITHLPTALFLLAGVWDWANKKFRIGGTESVEHPALGEPPITE